MPLREDTEFSGPVTASLRFSCNEIDSHVIARLGRVDAAGAYHLLSLGVISPARRRIDRACSTATEVAIDISHPEDPRPTSSYTRCLRPDFKQALSLLFKPSACGLSFLAPPA